MSEERGRERETFQTKQNMRQLRAAMCGGWDPRRIDVGKRPNCQKYCSPYREFTRRNLRVSLMDGTFFPPALLAQHAFSTRIGPSAVST